MTNQQWKEQYINGLLESMKAGSFAVPYLLVKYYNRLKLTDMEVMLLIHILAFKEKEQNDFPTIEEIQKRMSSEPEEVINTIQRLIKKEFLTIDENIDPSSGIQYEHYNFFKTYEKLAKVYADEIESRFVNSEPENLKETIHHGNQREKDIFTIFEKEFARPLSPMECETISSWLDEDKYNQEIILAALKEAVFAGKLHFTYIDRILLDWSRNRVLTAEQAKTYSQKFRGTR